MLYKLVGKEPVRCATGREWVDWFENAGEVLIVGQDEIGGLFVLTVFTGIDQGGGSPPQLFETLRTLMTDQHPPVEKLCPESWSKAGVDALEGYPVRFRDGGGGTIRDAVGLVNDQNEIYLYAVHVSPDAGPTILLSKGDAATGD